MRSASVTAGFAFSGTAVSPPAQALSRGGGTSPAIGGTSPVGGVPCVWNDGIVASPHACPLARSASVQVMVSQSGAKTSRAHGLHSSIRFPPGSYT